MKFDKFPLAEEIKKNLEANKYFRTTDIQYKAIPAILNGEDVLAIAPTGTGKTAAFAIPVIQQIHHAKTSKRGHRLSCLVMVPTRELAQQIGEVFSSLSKHTKATSFAVYGGIEQDQQIRQLEGGIDILIATPGRLFDLVRQKYIDIGTIHTLVLDEADRMLDLGFIEDIKYIKAQLRHRHQTLFFSATINPKIKKLAYSQINSKALRIQISPENRVSKNVSHAVVKVKMDEKRALLVNLIKNNPDMKCMVFVRTQVRAERITEYLLKNSMPVCSIHGGMQQDERENNLEAFKKLRSGVLVATDVTARGIDLTGISHVINFDLPDDPENYIHRVGRTGRGFNKGDALSFCAPEEAQKLKDIEEFLNLKLDVVEPHRAFLTGIQKDTDEMSIQEMLLQEEALFSKKRSIPKKSKTKSKTKN